MSKTAEEHYNKAVYNASINADNDSKENNIPFDDTFQSWLKIHVTEAMHTYAEQRAVEFAEWCDASQYNYFGKGTWLGFDNVQYTTYGLYTIYLNQQNKK